MDNRAADFRCWIRMATGLSHFPLGSLKPAAAMALLAVYTDFVKNTRKNSEGQPILVKSIVAHLNAAHAFLQAVTGRVIPIYQGQGKNAKLIPLIGHTIALQQKWQQPKPKREPLTWDILAAFHRAVKKQCKHDPFAILDHLASSFDWTRLSCFTGSRAGEYAQTVAKRGEFSKAPHDEAAGMWQGWSVAFVEEDFTLLDKHSRIIPINLNTLSQGAQIISEVHIRFRFDKSPQNFTIQKFQKGHSFLCPIDAVVSILLRARILGTTKERTFGCLSNLTRRP